MRQDSLVLFLVLFVGYAKNKILTKKLLIDYNVFALKVHEKH